MYRHLTVKFSLTTTVACVKKRLMDVNCPMAEYSHFCPRLLHNNAGLKFIWKMLCLMCVCVYVCGGGGEK
jgi:hypothetical protein